MSHNKPPEPQDKCPRWAAEMIRRIGELEVQLGNLAPAEDWQVANVKEVLRRLQEDDSEFQAGVVESLFEKVSRDLTEAGFSSAEIAGFINSRIPSGRVPYCNSSEVEAALAQQN